jgi:ABC-type branched-subunit amino acid transport system permease subunit
MVATVLLYVVACLGLTIQLGFAGVLNFASTAFFGIGCYTAAVLTTSTPLPHLLVLLAGGLMAALIGSLLLYPVLRTRGHYAAVITIAFALLFRTFLEVNDALGGPQGLRVEGADLFGWAFNQNLRLGPIRVSFYFNYVLLALVLAVIAFVLVRRLERSWIGLNLDAIRLDETAAACFGIDPGRWKITAFTLGNFLAGVAGALFGMMLGFIAPTNFSFADSLIMVSIVLLGGIGNPWGVVLAAIVVIVVPEKAADHPGVPFSAVRADGDPDSAVPARGAAAARASPLSAPEPSPLSPALLVARDLTRRFGGLIALDRSILRSGRARSWG